MLDRIDIKYFKLAVGSDAIGKETDVDIEARCPVCGDSKTHKNKKRLHLYNKGEVTNVNCFNGNCPVENKTVFSFLRDFYPSHLANYKRETFGNTMEQLKTKKDATGDVFSKFKTSEKVKRDREVVVQDLSGFLKDISEVPEALNYIQSRKLEYKESAFGKWYYGIQNIKIGETTYPISDCVVIPLYYENEMYGFYSRSIKTKDFWTYMNDVNIGYKVWNWFNIDKTKPVYIYEGIFDAIAGGLPNSIALMGAKLPEARLKELKQPVFVLDNDKTGLVNSLDYAKAGNKVYIQPLMYDEKDMNELMKYNTGINVSNVIINNIFTGLSAEIRIKSRL